MGVILFTITVCILVFVGFLIYKNETDEESVGTVSTARLNGQELQEHFKEAHLWACETFGVRKNVYSELESNLHEYKSLGVPYFTYYYVSHYRHDYYPNIPFIESEITDWKDETQHRVFALEFISLVNSMRARLDAEDFELFNKYEIPFKNLLTKEFKVDKLSLHQLPE